MVVFVTDRQATCVPRPSACTPKPTEQPKPTKTSVSTLIKGEIRSKIPNHRYFLFHPSIRSIAVSLVNLTNLDFNPIYLSYG
jgi:hypothetical protein